MNYGHLMQRKTGVVQYKNDRDEEQQDVQYVFCIRWCTRVHHWYEANDPCKKHEQNDSYDECNHEWLVHAAVIDEEGTKNDEGCHDVILLKLELCRQVIPSVA